MAKSNKDVVYKKMELREHIFSTCDTYVGSDKIDKVRLHIFSDEKKQIIDKEFDCVEALYKIYDEIVVNALDETKRTEKCNTIKINIEKDEESEKTKITVYNNGNGIAIEKHEEEDVYKPQLIFGTLLTSANYNKSEEKIVGGKNGYGAKLTNIFSKRFEVTVIDPESKKKYVQIYEDNMTKVGKPKITSCKDKTGSVQISYVADYERFNLKDLSKEMFALFKKRAYDIAACVNATGKKIKVYFNDELIKENTFAKYIDLYYPEGSKFTKVIDDTNERWKICAVYNEGSEFKTVGFVNGLSTNEGKHCDYVVGQIIKELTETAKKKCKNITISAPMIKDGLHIFIDSVIVNPSFTSQSKTKLTTPVIKFGSKYTVPEKFITKLAKSGVMNNIINNAKVKELNSINKQNAGKKKSKIYVEKLEDATDAGGPKSASCALILTEGDSAKASAMSGRKVIGNTKFGIFPLKGKMLNVRKATVAQLLKNEEVNNIIKIIGLQHKKEYTSTKSLRYGKIIILADQDYDGSHIKGLLINFIHYFWPSLLKNVKDFIVSLPTPIIKAISSGKTKKTETFYTLNEYEKWKENKPSGKWTVKYYKGLGTSTAKEACEWFENFEGRMVRYQWTDEEYDEVKKISKSKKKKSEEEEEDDEENSEVESITHMPAIKNKCEDALLLGFDNDHVARRKDWLLNYDRNAILDNSKTKVPFYEFIHKDLKHFSNYDLERSIPSLIDGLKPSLRKILYGIIKKNVSKEIKVAQLAGYVSEHCGYHHGEASLTGAIIGMAQNYVGSNNINILYPAGQFGTRVGGGDDLGCGKDHASPRYIFTYLTDIAKIIFPVKDMDILKYLDDDGMKIEPEWFCPIIPMILVNGTKGIGTGFSTSIPSYNPLDIIKNIKRLMNGKELKEMTPWYNGFTGEITSVGEGKYETHGKFEPIDENKLRITELPIGISTSKYKLMLEEMLLEEEKPTKKKTEKTVKKKTVDNFLEDVIADNTDDTINFTLTFKKGLMNKMLSDGTLEKKLKLIKPVNTRNMYLFNEKNVITKYKTTEDIIREHYNVRTKMYVVRKKYLLKKLNLVLELLKWKRKFIRNVLDKVIIINRKKKSEIIEKLVELGFPELNEKKDRYVKEEDGDEEVEDAKKSYNYITRLPLFSLTEEEIEKLENEYNKTKKEVEDLEGKTEIDLWNEELDQFSLEYEKFSSEYKK